MSKRSMNTAFLSELQRRDREFINEVNNYQSIQTLPEIWAIAADLYKDTVALCDPHAKPEVRLTYEQLYAQIRQFATGLQALGVQPEQRISLIADNSPRWFIADQGAMLAGAVDAVRSAQAEREELLFIIRNSGSTGLIVENLQTLTKLQSGISDLPIEFVILLSSEKPTNDGLKILNFNQVMELGESQQLQPVQRQGADLATLIYTSGTTGKPKGVMLTHNNLMHQVKNLRSLVQPQIGNVVLSILPTWHSYERSAEYLLLSLGCTQIYTNLRSIKRDLKEFKPNYIVAVPRLVESIYEGVQKQFREQPASKQRLIFTLLGLSEKYIRAQRLAQGLDTENLQVSAISKFLAQLQALFFLPCHKLGEKIVYNKVREATGGKVKQILSGGGALPRHIDLFFEIIGVEILVGYGLTETSPVTHGRRSWRNMRNSAGLPIPGTEVQIVDPETRQPLPIGKIGLVLLRGPQIMQGYYQNPEATTKAIDPQGWFDSGDLGWITPENDLILTGRAKDTIVLSNGENIEPQPIEDACLRSPFIDQIMLVGQDQRYLGALIVPNLEALENWGKTQNIEISLGDNNGNGNNNATLSGSQVITLESKIIQDLFRQELNREVQNRPGYRPDDRIVPFKLITEPFSIENGLMTQTLKLRRHIVMDRYSNLIQEMFV